MEDSTLENKTEPIKKKIFIAAIGSYGDVKPFLILAKELKKRGYIVWLGVHQRFEKLVNDEGIDTVLIDGDLEITFSTTPDGIELQRNPSIFKISLVKRVFLPLMEEWFNGILNGLKDADLLILSVMSIIPGLSCVQKSEKTKVIGIFSYPCLRTNEFPPPALSGKSESSFNWVNSMKWKMFEYGAASMYSETINRLRANNNLPPIHLYYEQLAEAALKKQIISATIYSKYLISRPADWPENNLLVGPIFEPETDQSQTIPSDLEEFIDKWKNEKIFYIGIGSMMSIMFGKNEQLQFLDQIQSALRQTKIKAIFSLVGFQNLNENPPANEESIFYLKQTVPHSWLFSKISAAIHHGGAGTTHASVRSGLPTLILPFGADQPFNADRVCLNHLGPKPIPIRELTVNKLIAAIQDILTNFNLYKNNARKIGPLMENEDGLGRCIQIIEKELI